MLLVKTQLRSSNINGMGCFAAQDVSESSVIWSFMPGFDLELSREFLIQLPQPVQEQVFKYAYLDKELDRYILCSDDARFFNHSKMPNTKEISSIDGYGVTIAARDIEEGEEITCDYETFDSKYDYTF